MNERIMQKFLNSILASIEYANTVLLCTDEVMEASDTLNDVMEEIENFKRRMKIKKRKGVKENE